MYDFSDLDDAAVSADPLVVLPCGHAFVTSCLDRALDMAKFYSAAEGGAASVGYAADGVTQWAAVRPLPAELAQQVPTCPHCRCAATRT